MLRDIHIYPEKIFYPTLLLTLWLGHLASAQNPIIANASLAEKIYLQLDRNVYTTSETIWFKSILVSAANHTPNTLSGVLHVELIGPDEQVVEKKLVEIKHGVGDSFFQLDDAYPTGKYLIRAYTEWNRNFGADFIFHTYIDVFPSSEKNLKNIITNINFSENPTNLRLTAQIDPQAVDSLHKEEIEVYLTLDNQKDTISIYKNTNGLYDLDYEIESKAALITIGIETTSGIKHTRTIAPDEEPLDVQFLPESGQLIHGITNLVGFKALGPAGRGRSVEGELVDAGGKIITTFKSNHLGMGKFYIRADSSTTYYARISSSSTPLEPLEYPLPAVVPRGSSLSVSQRNDAINLMVFSNVQKQDSIFIQASSRGIAQYIIKGELKEGQAAFSVPTKGLPEGIVAFTLMNSTMQPIAERLFFIERPESRLDIELSIDKETYYTREKTNVDVKVTSSQGKATKASLSLVAINTDETRSSQSKRQNILSQLLLNSELRGEVEEPGFYFRKDNENRRSDLDALLLTQGWRRYNYNQPPEDSLYIEPEITLNVTGTVGGIFSKNNMKEGIGISLMTFGNSPSVSIQETDSLGRFYFPIYNERGHRVNILLQTTNKSGRNRNYSISLKEHTPPKIFYDHRKAIKDYNSEVEDFVRQIQSQNDIFDDLEFSPEVNRLDEVVVDGYRMTPARKKVMDTYGKPDSVIESHRLQEKEQKWSYGLYSVIASNFPDDIRLKRVGGAAGYMKAEVVGGDETIVLVDGIPIREDDFPLIPNLPTSEIRSVEIIRHVQNFQELYREVYPVTLATDVPKWGSIIAIYTDGGTGILGANKPVGVLKTAVSVFSPDREFYAPKYEDQSSKNGEKPDLRTTIHWDPQISPDNTGITSTISFYNSDIPGQALVIIEGISEEGEIGYKEIQYTVKEAE